MNATNGAEGTDAVNGADREAPQPGDPELAALVRSVDEGQVGGMPVTVLVGGASISGDLISGAQWWETMGQLARRTEAGDVSEQFAAGADSIRELYSSADVTERRPIGYLHMQNIATAGSNIVGLRIRMEEIQGWRWGS
jgi:hypothetical protein